MITDEGCTVLACKALSQLIVTNVAVESKMLLFVCSSSKNPYPPHGRSLEIRRGRGILIAEFLEAMYENKPEFPEGEGGCKTNNLPWGEHGYFLKLYN